MTTTPADAISAAMSLAKDVAEGRLDVAALEAQAVAELRGLLDTEPEPGSALAVLQLEVARRVLARGDLPADELVEWTGVARRREAGGGDR